MTKLYLVTADSESGDSYFFGTYDEKPTKEHLLAIAVNDCPEEIFYGECCLHFNIQEIDDNEIQSLPEPYTAGDIAFL